MSSASVSLCLWSAHTSLNSREVLRPRTWFGEHVSVEKKLPVLRVRRGLYQQIKPFSNSNCCVVLVSLKLGLNRHTDSSKKFTTNLVSSSHGFQQKLWFFKENISLHPSRITALLSRISGKALVFK